MDYGRSWYTGMTRPDDSLEERAGAETSSSDDGRGGTAEAVRDDVESLRSELTELNAKWLRALADLDNYRKRVERERARWTDEAREALLLSLLDIVDDFERAVACGENEGPPPEDPLREGVQLILKRLLDVLEKNGVRSIDTCGAEFDPALHEAVGQVESQDHESNEIVEELRRGYTLGDRLLRCSRVIVAR